MKQIFTILIFLIVCHLLPAQKLVTEGKQWTVSLSYPYSDGENGEIIKNDSMEVYILKGEHTLGTYIYKALYRQQQGDNPELLVGYLREENDKVYHIAVGEDQTLSEEGLLYDFGLIINDSIGIENYFTNQRTAPGYPLYVKSLDYEEVEGMIREKIEIAPLFDEYWYETIGSSLGIIYSGRCHEGRYATKLTSCIDGDGTVLYSASPLRITNPHNNEIRAYIDSQKILHVENAPNVTFSLYDITGKFIREFISNTESSQINLSSLSRGMYIISSKSINFRGKILAP